MLKDIPTRWETFAMAVTFQIPLDIPDVALLSTEVDAQGALLIKVESTLNTTRCRRCGRNESFSWLRSTDSLTSSADSGADRLYRAAPKALSVPHCRGGRRRRNAVPGIR